MALDNRARRRMTRLLDSPSTRIISLFFPFSASCRNADFHEGKCLETNRRPPTRSRHAWVNGEEQKLISIGHVDAEERHVNLRDEKIFTEFSNRSRNSHGMPKETRLIYRPGQSATRGCRAEGLGFFAKEQILEHRDFALSRLVRIRNTVRCKDGCGTDSTNGAPGDGPIVGYVTSMHLHIQTVQSVSYYLLWMFPYELAFHSYNNVFIFS